MPRTTKRFGRPLHIENLERRDLLAADLGVAMEADGENPPSATVAEESRPFMNSANSLDVNDDGWVTPMDVLNVVNDLNTHGARQLTLPSGEDSSVISSFVDVNGDGYSTPGDVLALVNHFNITLHSTDVTPGATDSDVDKVFDVDDSGTVTNKDAELLVQTLNETGSRKVTDPPSPESPTQDVNGDGHLSPLDVLAVVNQLKKKQAVAPLDTEKNEPEALDFSLPLEEVSESLLSDLLQSR